MWFIGVEVEQETSAPPPKKNPGSAPGEEPEKAPIFSHVFVFWYVSSRKAGALRDEASRARTRQPKSLSRPQSPSFLGHVVGYKNAE